MSKEEEITRLSGLFLHSSDQLHNNPIQIWLPHVGTSRWGPGQTWNIVEDLFMVASDLLSKEGPND